MEDSLHKSKIVKAEICGNDKHIQIDTTSQFGNRGLKKRKSVNPGMINQENRRKEFNNKSTWQNEMEAYIHMWMLDFDQFVFPCFFHFPDFYLFFVKKISPYNCIHFLDNPKSLLYNKILHRYIDYLDFWSFIVSNAFVL